MPEIKDEIIEINLAGMLLSQDLLEKALSKVRACDRESVDIVIKNVSTHAVPHFIDIENIGQLIETSVRKVIDK